MNERSGVNLVTPTSWRMVWGMVSTSTRGAINPPMKRKSVVRSCPRHLVAYDYEKNKREAMNLPSVMFFHAR